MVDSWSFDYVVCIDLQLFKIYCATLIFFEKHSATLEGLIMHA